MPRDTRITSTLEGIVLRVYPSGDSDFVMRVLTANAGKVSIIAKHARRGGKRFNGTLDLFDCGRFEIRAGRGSLAILQGFAPTQSFTGLRNSLDKIASGSLLCEIIDYFTMEDGDDEAVQYESLRGGLKALELSTTRGELLSIVYEHAALFSQTAGFFDTSRFGTGSTKKLKNMLDHIEHCAERKLMTRSTFDEILNSFIRQTQEKPTNPT